MCFGVSASNSLLESRLLVVLIDAEAWDDHQLFGQIFSEAFNSTILASEVHWFRNNVPSSLPKDICPPASLLSRITFHYGHNQNVNQIIDFCANVLPQTFGSILLLVELDEADVPHYTSLGSIMALLADTSKVLSSKKNEDGSLTGAVGFTVVALVATKRFFDSALIVSLYTDCIVHQLPDGSFQAVLSE